MDYFHPILAPTSDKKFLVCNGTVIIYIEHYKFKFKYNVIDLFCIYCQEKNVYHLQMILKMERTTKLYL